MIPLLRARAAGQSGLLTRSQALDGGLSPKAVEWRLRKGGWLVVHPGVYQTQPGRRGWDVLGWTGRPRSSGPTCGMDATWRPGAEGHAPEQGC
jgi:hypothetical protein